MKKLRHFYCPFCKEKIVVAMVDVNFNNCECPKCKGIMLVDEDLTHNPTKGE